ncbi:MAG: HAMP domain-containing histidine kinase [Butyrivibrio sp.]|nr:HAMP domain-containing histidine kinase [Butyrivibrio sp.]
MKRYLKYCMVVALYFLCWMAVIYVVFKKCSANDHRNRITYMNRMTEQISQTGEMPDLEDFPDEDRAIDIRIYSSADRVPGWVGGEDNTYVWTLKDENGNITGFVRYVFKSNTANRMFILAELSAFVFFIPLVVCWLVMDRRVLKPFRDFSDYPEKLSKGLTSDGLPETKSRLFGKYVWGMNMLSDKLEYDRKEIERLLYDRKKFISTLAHGIKTPVANIKLYSEAIGAGLYRGGVPDENDSKIAEKINKNADDITELVRGILEDPGALKSSYNPKFESFYLQDIKDKLIEDFQNRCMVNNTPFEVELTGNPLVTSDIGMVIKCLTQLMENAIKYGDGTGIKVKLYRQDDVTFFSVINNGVTINKEEIPFLFNCYYRGSNSADKEGSGIGLYEARSVARSLGGDIIMNISGNKTEVLMYVTKV